MYCNNYANINENFAYYNIKNNLDLSRETMWNIDNVKSNDIELQQIKRLRWLAPYRKCLTHRIVLLQ